MHDRDSDAYKLPRPRKITLTIILASVFTNCVLIITTLVRPSPQFSDTGVLMQIQAVALEDLGHYQTFQARDNVPGRAEFLMPTAPPGVNVVNLARRADDEDAFWLQEDCEACDTEPEQTAEPTTTSKPRTRETAHTTWRTSTDRVVVTTSEEVSSAEPVETAAVALPSLDRPADGVYVSIWIGPLGACLQRFAGNLVCSGGKFSQNFGPIYNQSGLPAEVISLLPTSVHGADVGLLLATLAYIVSLFFFAVSLSPPLFVLSPWGQVRSLDIRHQVTLSINSVLVAIAILATFISTIVLRNDFNRAVKAIPALDDSLRAKTGASFTQLYVVCVLGGLSLLQCLMLIAEDLRFPWWYLGPASRQRNPWQTSPEALDFTMSGLKRSEPELPPNFLLGGGMFPANSIAGTRM